MITKLVINKASYNKEEGVKLEGNDLLKLNVFYGANGSGKTTLVNVIKEQDRRHVVDNKVITWKDKEQEIFLYFDEEFITEHFKVHRDQMNGITPGLIDKTSDIYLGAKKMLKEINKIKVDTQNMVYPDLGTNHNYSKSIQDVLFDKNASSDIIKYYKLQGGKLYDFFQFEYSLYLKETEAKLEDIQKYNDNYLTTDVAKDNPLFVELIKYNKKIIAIYPKLFFKTIPCYILHFFLVEKPLVREDQTALLKCNDIFSSNFDIKLLYSILNEYTQKRLDEIKLLENIEKSKMLQDVKIVADNINTQLRYYNYNDVSIEVVNAKNSKNHGIIPTFKLKRENVKDANVWNTLSEAEKHFVAFLYFYQLCLGYDNYDDAVAAKKKVIVFDDPVTSMDSNTLFIVSQMLCDLFRKDNDNVNKFYHNQISQGFILTHNSYFFKEFELRRKIKCTPNINVSMIYRDIDTGYSQIKPQYEYKDDYTLMWENLKEINDKRKNYNKSMNVIIGNLCRRIIESYGRFMGFVDITDNGLSSLLRNIKNEGVVLSPHEEVLFNSFIAMINTESHSSSTTEDAYYQTVSDLNTSQIFDIFKKLFKKLEGINFSHYDHKMGC